MTSGSCLKILLTRCQSQQRRLILAPFSCVIRRQRYSFWSSINGNGLQKAINSAERVVGYPTNFSSLKFLVDEEEPTNFIKLAKKLVGSGHPLLTTARDLLSQDPYSSHQLGGLWVLLISKAVKNESDLLNDVVGGIHRKQRILAETTELISTAFLIHRSMLSLKSEEFLQDLNKKTLSFGNKLSVLGGDFLLAKASLELARLENTQVVGLIAQAIGDMAEGATIEALDVQADLTWTVNDWENFVYLLKGSLMANSCKAATVLTCQPEKVQQDSFTFGKNLTLAQQCAEDIETFQNKKSILKNTNLLLILALQRCSSLKEKFDAVSTEQGNISRHLKELKHDIPLKCPNVIEEAKKMCDEYVATCSRSIECFEQNDAVSAIEDILKTVHET